MNSSDLVSEKDKTEEVYTFKHGRPKPQAGSTLEILSSAKTFNNTKEYFKTPGMPYVSRNTAKLL